jgi:hypothetical protein
MKHCNGCGRDLTEDQFYWKFKGSGLRQSRCIACESQYRKEHYRKNAETVKRQAKVRSLQNVANIRQLILEYMLSHPCVDCGERDPIVLEFDHVRGVKEFSISSVVYRGKPWVKIQKEIEKCDVRCANCHRRKTAKQFGWNSNRRLKIVKSKSIRVCCDCHSPEGQVEFRYRKCRCVDCYRTYQAALMRKRRSKAA